MKVKEKRMVKVCKSESREIPPHAVNRYKNNYKELQNVMMQCTEIVSTVPCQSRKNHVI